MALNNKLTTTAALLAASFAFGSVAYADVCDTPSKLGNMGSFPGEVITIQGSLLGTDQEMLLNTVCLLYTSPSPRDRQKSRMPSSA